MSYAKELRIAQLAVERACKLTKLVAESQQSGSVSKSDHSPVTGKNATTYLNKKKGHKKFN